jgi:manganese transport protein
LLGPAFVVSIGYIDPGNWATDLGAGTYGYRLLWVVLVASAIAIVLQMAVSELTIATGEDLATLISRRWPRLSPTFWAIFQGAAVATDVAEFSGIVLGGSCSSTGRSSPA